MCSGHIISTWLLQAVFQPWAPTHFSKMIVILHSAQRGKVTHREVPSLPVPELGGRCR